ncbi:MAG: FAD:protein FMN transferase [Planctomycetes bacterium]|nr:FAD:protein FMN transferase [Planctomycetota bacterium]
MLAVDKKPVQGQSMPCFRQVRFLMNTFVKVVIYEDDSAKAERAMNYAFDEMKRLEAMMSRFQPDSQVFLINQSAGQAESVRVSPEVMSVLEESIRISRLTQGAFDITIAPLMNLWSSVSALGRFPIGAELNDVLPLVNYQAIKIDRIDQTVRLPDKGIAIDLGGIGKGYAIDRVIFILKSAGIKDALIDVGGNICVMGDAPSEKGWSIGIQHPLNETQVVAAINLGNEAMATSGGYERFFTVNNRKLCHIINPSDGNPVHNNVLSVSIISGSAILGDALSTAVFVLGVEKGIALMDKFKDVEVVIIHRTQPLRARAGQPLLAGAGHGQSREDSSVFQAVCSEGLKGRINFRV